MKTTLLLTLALVLCATPLTVRPAPATGHTFTIGERDFLLDGQPFLIRCGEMHFARIPQEYWAHRLRMAHAMGLNTVCAYLFWNVHEPEPGQFVFTGNADVMEFCRLAQAEGLKVILRPGPYSCAEWDFGGFPYWLLKTQDIKLRTRDPRYLAACERYLHEVGKRLGQLQIDRGGPIIMVQVENEYGSYGSDKQYLGILRDDLKAAGFEVPLFTCDGPSQLKNDTRDDLFCVVNFGGGPEGNFKALRVIRPQGPLMCGEYYPGWFDSWGKPHHTGDSARLVSELGWMLGHNASFSIYMVHGGTSFGFTAGANCPPFSPQVTSYDYDAPVSEAGWDTPKFHALRELFLKHLAPGEVLPEVPRRNPVIHVERFELSEAAPLLANLNELTTLRHSDRPICMENLDQPHGLILYRTQLPAGEAALLRITELHDYSLVFLNGQKLDTLDRRHNQNSVRLPARAAAKNTLDLLVDTFGHVNYGGYIHDRKGITEKVELVTASSTNELAGPAAWSIFTLALSPSDLAKLRFKPGATEMPAFYRATFDVKQVGDTFIDLGTWNKGMAWINGHNLGRFWNLGPQQTLYCPGPWLKAGRNELVVFELNGTTNHSVAGLAEPILNQLSEQALVKKHRLPGQKLNLDNLRPIATGSFASGKDWQTVKFEPAKGRYLCLEALNSHSDDDYTTCAELNLLGADGSDLPRDPWRVAYADSEEVEGDDGRADNVFDLQPTTFWHTEWEAAHPPHPHQIVIDLGSEQTIAGLRYLPRQDSPNGRIRDYRIYLSAVAIHAKEPPSVELNSQPVEARPGGYQFDGTMSRQVLENYLARSITVEGLFNGRGDLKDNLRMLKSIGAKYLGRALCLWGAENNFLFNVRRAREQIPLALAADPEMIVEGCVFETVSPKVNEIAIPDWVFTALGQPVEKRNFHFEDIIYPEGQRRPMGRNAQVPDVSRLETQLWFYYQAASYIDAGCEAIHFGQVEIMNQNDRGNTNWFHLLGLVRQYATGHARRHLVLCNGHVPTGGLMHAGNPLLDFHAFPLRIKETPDKPQEAVLEAGFTDAIYNRSKGGKTFSGWSCEHLPYLVEFDNYGLSDHPGRPYPPQADNRRGFLWIWGYDEITWFSLQSKEYRAKWLQYAWDWVRTTDTNGYVEMPGGRVARGGKSGWYYANKPSDATPDGLGDEDAIRSVWAADTARLLK